MADYPLPIDTIQAFRSAGRNCRNFGLLFERYLGYGPNWTLDGSHKQAELSKLVDACNRWKNKDDYKVLYWGLRTRLKAIMESAKARPFEATPEWRLVVGLGKDNPYEIGLTLHRIYGCPVVPGSALKGMTRAWAEATDKEEEKIEELFGVQNQAGDAVFFDALPFTPPKLEMDVLNPHYPDYYQDDASQPPADWQSPKPVYFVTVAAGTKFLFGVGSRTKNSENAQVARQWMKSALQEMGVGGKTSAGYGFFRE
jgi:CRISPR-associated protein Cmr6